MRRQRSRYGWCARKAQYGRKRKQVVSQQAVQIENDINGGVRYWRCRYRLEVLFNGNIFTLCISTASCKLHSRAPWVNDSNCLISCWRLDCSSLCSRKQITKSRESNELTERWYRYIERIPVIDQIPLELFARTVLDAKMQREKKAKFNDGCESIVS